MSPHLDTRELIQGAICATCTLVLIILLFHHYSTSRRAFHTPDSDLTFKYDSVLCSFLLIFIGILLCGFAVYEAIHVIFIYITISPNFCQFIVIFFISIYPIYKLAMYYALISRASEHDMLQIQRQLTQIQEQLMQRQLTQLQEEQLTQLIDEYSKNYKNKIINKYNINYGNGNQINGAILNYNESHSAPARSHISNHPHTQSEPCEILISGSMNLYVKYIGQRIHLIKKIDSEEIYLKQNDEDLKDKIVNLINIKKWKRINKNEIIEMQNALSLPEKGGSKFNLRGLINKINGFMEDMNVENELDDGNGSDESEESEESESDNDNYDETAKVVCKYVMENGIITKAIFEKMYKQSHPQYVKLYHDVCSDMNENNEEYNHLFYFRWNGQGYRLILVDENLKKKKKANEKSKNNGKNNGKKKYKNKNKKRKKCDSNSENDSDDIEGEPPKKKLKQDKNISDENMDKNMDIDDKISDKNMDIDDGINDNENDDKGYESNKENIDKIGNEKKKKSVMKHGALIKYLKKKNNNKHS